MAGAPLGFPRGPEDLLIDAKGEPLRIDKAFSWEAPLAAHGMMHMVIANACSRRSLPYRYVVSLYGQYGLEHRDEYRGDDTDAGRRESATAANIGSRGIIYSDAYYSEMVAYADLVLPDTTYLER